MSDDYLTPEHLISCVEHELELAESGAGYEPRTVAGQVWVMIDYATRQDVMREGRKTNVEYGARLETSGWLTFPEDGGRIVGLPTETWVADRKHFGYTVAKRTIIVVEDWEEL